MIEETTFSKCLSPELESRFKHLWCLVGNTPMLELQYVYKGKPGKKITILQVVLKTVWLYTSFIKRIQTVISNQPI